MVTDPDAVDRLLEEPRVEVEGGAAMVATGFEQARIRAGSRIVFHAHPTSLASSTLRRLP